MSPLGALDWLDLVGYGFTRTASFERADPTMRSFMRWRAANNPPWRQRVTDAKRILRDYRSAEVRGPLDLLARCASEVLQTSSTGYHLPEDWPVSILMRSRLPTGTLQAAAFAGKADGAPPSALRLMLAPKLRQMLRREELVDGHVHVGAILPFDALFRLAIPSWRAHATASEPVRFLDSSGSAFDLGQVLGYAAALDALLRLGDPSPRGKGGRLRERAAGATVDNALLAAVEAGRGWQFLGEQVPDVERRDIPRWRKLDDYMPSELLAPPELHSDQLAEALELKTAWLRDTRIASAEDLLQTRAVEDYLRCEALLHHATTQGGRTGLDEFLLASERLRTIRGASAGGKRRVVEQGLRHLSAGVPLHAIELRTCEQPEPGQHFDRDKLAKSLAAQFRGYRDYRASGAAHPPVAAWPICLVRDGKQVRRRSDATDDPAIRLNVGLSITEVPVRFDLVWLWHAIDAASTLLRAHPRARSLVPGLDVAGDETALPSWAAHLLFGEFDRRLREHPSAHIADIPSLSYRVHAGESYTTPVEGLRRIDEAITHVVPDGSTARIGHGLAVINPRWEPHPGMPAQRIDEAFDDLVWAWRTLTTECPEQAGRPLARELERQIVAHGQELYGITGAGTPQRYCDAYMARFDTDTLIRLGAVADNILAPTDDPRGVDRFFTGMITRPPTSTAEQILVRYLTDLELSAHSGPLIEEARMRELYERLRPVIIDRLRKHGAILEACPTSNLVIDGIPGFAKHPFVALLDEGIAFTVNTDDPGIFGTTLSDEYASLWLGMDGRTPDQRLDALRSVVSEGLVLVDWCTTTEQAAETIDAVLEEWVDIAPDDEDLLSPSVAGPTAGPRRRPRAACGCR